jgi:hypothetical protein
MMLTGRGRSFTVAALGALLAMFGPAMADPLFLYEGPLGASFSAIGGGMIEVSTSGIGSHAIYGQDIGSFGFFSLGAMDFTAVPYGPIAVSETFTYTSPDDSLSGVISWQSLFNGGEAAGEIAAGLRGVLTVASSVGDAAFLTDFSAGSSNNAVAYLLPPCAIDLLAAGNCGTNSEFGYFDGGAILATNAAPVPEPSALSLLLAALSSLALSAGAAFFQRFPFSPGGSGRAHPNTSFSGTPAGWSRASRLSHFIHFISRMGTELG